MIRNVFSAALAAGGMLLSASGYGQEIPLGALPMQYNGSFAGEAGSPRISSNVRLHPDEDSNQELTIYNSYDQFIPAIRSGIGISSGYSTALLPAKRHYYSFYSFGNGYSVRLAIAPKFSLNGRVTISPSLDVGYAQGKFSYRFPPNNDTTPPLIHSSESYAWQSRAGLLLNTRKFYVGYAVYLADYVNVRLSAYPERNFSGRRATFTSYLQMGYTFRRSSESKFSFTPQLVFYLGRRYNSVRYGRSDRFYSLEAINLNFKYKQVIWGLNNAGIHVGWRTDKMRLILTNGYSSSTGYIGNLSFRYVFKNNAWSSVHNN